MAGTSPGIPVMVPAASGSGPAIQPAVTFGEGRRPESRLGESIAEQDQPGGDMRSDKPMSGCRARARRASLKSPV